MHATPDISGSRRVSFATLGCKLNYAESSTYARQFRQRGYEIVPHGTPADVAVINTCSVTENADREARKLVRQALRHSNGTAYVVVVGCYAQLRPEEIASIDGVDLVLGASEKFDMLRYIGEGRKEAAPRIHVGDVDEADVFGAAFAAESADRTRAFLKVQDGCDYSCSFCTIPMARGGSRSLDIDSAVQQARTIVEMGFHEIVLSGVNVGDYGRHAERSLLDLLRAILTVDGEYRLRISSIEPNLLTDEIIALMAGDSRLCPHVHVPLQSGSPDLLRAMRRRYTREQYAQRIHAVLAAVPDAAVGIDVIVGFPGETDAHFEETRSFLHELPCAYLHVFSYSERPDTPAAVLSGRVDPSVRAERSRVLRILSEKKRMAFSLRQLGRTHQVLFETEEHDGCSLGWTGNYVRVAVPYNPRLANTVHPVRLREAGEGWVHGELIPGPAAPADWLSLPVVRHPEP